jgi:glutathionylspermidine synthase
MRRLSIQPRDGWQAKLERLGCYFHSDDTLYWNESACYEFESREVDEIEAATNALQELCASAVDTVIQKNWFERMKISDQEARLIRESWDRDELSLYGRFDLAWSGYSAPKMLEYNADTPTSIFESAIIQWEWLADTQRGKTQFNSLHEKLKARWPKVADRRDRLYFFCVKHSAEDIAQTEYLRDVAQQAGFDTDFLFIEDLGWDARYRHFADFNERRVGQGFKLYPWEWLAKEQFGHYLGSSTIRLIEPAWKRVLSTKAILPILWELFPGHPNLLPAFFEAPRGMDYVKKPMLSREGANVTIYKNGVEIFATGGEKESPDFIYQGYYELPRFEGRNLVIGSWIIGEEASGMGLREDASLVTRNLSQFVPHYIR